MLWASPANAGALELANKIAAAFAGLTISTADARPATATHMLLYLNEDSFSDERLAEQVKQARKDKLKIVMAHENDPDLGGCEFGRMFEVTPQERMPHSDARPEPPLPPHASSKRRRSSSPTGSTRPWHARASRVATTRRALCLSHISPFAHWRDSPARAFRSAGVARASGKGPRRDSRSVGQRRQHEPPLGQHRQAWQPARSHDQPPQLCDDNHRGRRLWRRGDGLGGLGGVRGLGGGGAGACLTLAADATAHRRHLEQFT